MKVPSSVTETRYDITSGPEEVFWERKTGTRRTGERQAFKTLWTQLTKIQQRLFSLLNPFKHSLLKMHVLYAFCF